MNILVITYKKSSQDSKKEYEIGKSLLPPELIPFYEEFEIGESFDAKFAASVDKLAPLLHEISSPKLTLKRFRIHGFDSSKIQEKKSQYFTLDKILNNIFIEIIESFKKIEKNEPSGFAIFIDIK